MQYVLLIYVSEAVTAGMSDSERQAYFQDYGTFEGEVQQRGIKTGGAPLQPISNSTSVRVKDGETLITDGPFAETKEQLAGFYVLECKDLDEAIALAAKMPDARYGTIEVRPVMPMP
ncbi:MAG: YciI family protein [Anaerolineae bacterium]|nr:YciI family protein [Anaerolineae bacterium]